VIVLSLSQQEADDLLALIKVLRNQNPISLPSIGNSMKFEGVDKGFSKIKFLFDVHRKTLNVRKCTYQTRSSGEILLRVDIEGSDHPNPDGTVIPCPHIHIYREGFSDRCAFPLGDHFLTNTHDLVRVLIDFLEYNHVENIPILTIQEGGLG